MEGIPGIFPFFSEVSLGSSLPPIVFRISKEIWLSPSLSMYVGGLYFGGFWGCCVFGEFFCCFSALFCFICT